MSSKRVKALLSDLFAFALSGASVKVLSFFMVPLYTFYLSTEDYAVADLVSLVIQLAIPLLTVSISDSVLRFGLDQENDKESVIGTGFAVMLLSAVLGLGGCLVIAVSSGNRLLALFCFLLYVLQSFNSYFAAVFKCFDKTKAMAAISSASGVGIVVLNVVLIAVLHLGLNGYWLGNVLGNLLGLILYLVFGAWRVFPYARKFDKRTLKHLLLYSAPLIPNSLFWWINTSMDRFVLTAFTSLSFVGLYSAASKIPQILSTVCSFFFQAWNISVFKDFGSKDSSEFFEKGFISITVVSFAVAGSLIVFNIPISSLLYSGDFFEAWKLVPLLLTGTVVSVLNQFLGSIFTASKETRVIFITTATGSFVNILSNIVLVICMGGIGAVIGTLISYLMVFCSRSRIVKSRYPFLNFDYRFPMVSFIFLIVMSLLAMTGAEVFHLAIIYAVMLIIVMGYGL